MKNLLGLFILLSVATFSPPILANVDFNDASGFDFDGDGVADQFNILGETKIEIKSGKTKAELFYFGGEEKLFGSVKAYLLLKDFKVLKLSGNYPSIVFATHYNSSSGRYKAPLMVLFNDRGILNLKRYSEYESAAYSVACTYPVKTAQDPALFKKSSGATRDKMLRPYDQGAYCIVGTYGVDLYARTAFIHIDKTGFIADVTRAVGLPWTEGINGTPVNNFPAPSSNVCGRSDSREKWHIMGVGMLDVNQDGLMDIVATGQHTRTFAFIQKAVPTTTGLYISFTEQAVTSNPGEFLIVGGYDANYSQDAKSTCFYQAIENRKNGCADNNKDHLMCYENSAWVRRELPFTFNNDVVNLSARTINDRVYFKTAGNRYFSYPLTTSTAAKTVLCNQGSPTGAACATLPDYVKGDIGSVSSTEVKGWACLKDYPQSINVHVYAGGPAGGGGTNIGSALANKESEAAVRTACGVTTGNYRFSFPVTAAMLAKHKGKAIYVYGIDPTRTTGEYNYAMNKSGTYSLPK